MSYVAQGDREAFEMLIRRHADGLLTFIYRMIGNRHRAEELFQEVFLAVWTQKRTYQQGRPFRPWLFGIALNKCRTDFRKARREAVDSLSDPPGETVVDDCPSPSEATINIERANMVSDAVARLSEQQRLVVVMRIWSGMSYRAISQALGCTEGTARSHMYHGLNTIRKYLEPRMQ